MTMYDLDAVLSKLSDDLKAIEATRQGIMDDIHAIQRAIMLANGDSEDDLQPVHGNAKPEDIMNCKTQMDAAVVLAQRNHKVLMVTPASKVIKAAGLSEAKITSIASTLHNRASTSDDWQYVEPGAFLYVGNDKTKDSQWSEPISIRATKAQAVSPIVLTTEDRKEDLSEVLCELAATNNDKISFNDIEDALKHLAKEESWNRQTFARAVSEIRRWLMESGHWQYEAPDTLRLRITQAGLTPANILSITAPRSV